MGVGRYLKSQKPSIAVHPLEPAESPTLSRGHKVGHHRIQGISDEFVPPIIHFDELDAVVQANDGDAILMAQLLAQRGLAVGISSGANVIGALRVQEHARSGRGGHHGAVRQQQEILEHRPAAIRADQAGLPDAAGRSVGL